MPIVTVSKSYYFEAGHLIVDHPICGQPHGHSFKLTVELTGSINPTTGMVIDFHDLSLIVKAVLKKYDHTFLNDNPALKSILMLTAETLVIHLCKEILRGIIFTLIQAGTGKTITSIRCTLQEGTIGGWASYQEEI